VKNLNKLRLEIVKTRLINGTAIVANVNPLARVANDFPKPLKIVAIKIALNVSNQIAVASATITLKVALGLTNNYNINTNFMEWARTITNVSASNGTVMPVYDINEIVGNFGSEIFTLEPFETETVGGNAPKGEIYANVGVTYVNVVASTNVTIEGSIILYYR